jgi:hypothetical protein
LFFEDPGLWEIALKALPLNAVRAFEAAARRGSFVEAAADLNVTHWAIGETDQAARGLARRAAVRKTVERRCVD